MISKFEQILDLLKNFTDGFFSVSLSKKPSMMVHPIVAIIEVRK